MELRLDAVWRNDVSTGDRRQRLFDAHEELLFSREALPQVWKLRRVLNGLAQKVVKRRAGTLNRQAEVDQVQRRVLARSRAAPLQQLIFR